MTNNNSNSNSNSKRTTIRAALFAAALAGLAALPTTAVAQDGGEDPNAQAEELRRRVREVDRLMGQAEKSLARSLDTRAARQRAARVAKLLDDKSREETGKSAEELRQEAAGGSAEAKATLERLSREALVEALGASKEVQRLLDDKAKKQTGESAEALRKLAENGSAEASKTLQKLLGEATDQALKDAMGAGESLKKMLEQAQSGEGSEGAGQGMKKMLDGTRESGEGVSKGIKWILDNAKGGKKPQNQKPDEKPKDDPDKAQKPPEETQPPQDPDKEKWLVSLPAQVRKAYETQDWDSIPPKWRDILREWTKKMAEELESGKTDGR